MTSDETPSSILPEAYRDVLLAISKYLNSPKSDGRLGYDNVTQLREYYSNLGYLRAILPDLVRRGFLTGDYAGKFYELTVDGLRACGFLLLANGTDVEEDPKDGWEPLALEQDSEPAQSAIRATEALLDRVRGENGLAQTEPDRFHASVWSLQTGLDAIKKHKPSRQQIQTLLIAPIRWLTAKFSGAAIGELAKNALNAILTWLS